MLVSQIRAWLERNKVFFEIFSSSLLGVAAIYVAYVSYLVSESQLRISKIGTQPHFYIETTLYQDSKSLSYDDVEMRLFNEGAAVNNINVDVKSFIKVNLFQEGVNPIYVPVTGYYFAQFPNHSPIGLITTFKGHKNNHHASKLYSAILNPEVMKGHPYFEITFVHITTINYLSPLGDKHDVVFLNREQVDKVAVKKIIEKYNQFYPLDIENLTVDTLLESANEQMRQVGL